jgi:hypothetical protein
MDMRQGIEGVRGARRSSTMIRRLGNKSSMNARYKDPPHSILGSHERALHMLLVHVRGIMHAIPEPRSLLV